MRLACVALALVMIVGCANDYGRFRIARTTSTTAATPGANEADGGASDAASDAR